MAALVEDLLVYLGCSDISWPIRGQVVLFTRADPPFHENRYAASLAAGDDDVAAALLAVIPYRDRFRLVISSTELDVEARSRLSGAGVSHFSVATLEEALGHFEEYRNYLQSLSLEERAESSNRPGTYIPLRIKLEGEEGETAWADGFFREWLEEESGRLICLTGDYGSGKTLLCERLATQWASSADGRWPVLIRLNEFVGTPQVESIIATWSSRFRAGLTFEAFLHMCRTGRFVVIADGLDELQTGVTERELIRNLTELLRLAEGRGKLILTSRTTFFRRYLHQTGVFEEALARSQLARLQAREQSAVAFLSISPFARRDVQRLAEVTLGSRAEDWLRSLRRHPQVGRLASTPLLLVLLLREWEAPHMQASGTADVIRHYVESWLRRDSLDYDLLLRERDREDFSEALAMRMLLNGVSRIGFEYLSEIVADLYGPRASQPRQIDYFDSELRTCTFLKRDDDGYFRFVHRIFQEFFLARAICRHVTVDGRSGITTLADVSAETWRMMHEMLRGALTSERARALLVTSKEKGSQPD